MGFLRGFVIYSSSWNLPLQSFSNKTWIWIDFIRASSQDLCWHLKTNAAGACLQIGFPKQKNLPVSSSNASICPLPTFSQTQNTHKYINTQIYKCTNLSVPPPMGQFAPSQPLVDNMKYKYTQIQIHKSLSSPLMPPFAPPPPKPLVSTFSENNKFRASERIRHFNFRKLTLGITFDLPREVFPPSHIVQTHSPFPSLGFPCPLFEHFPHQQHRWW